MRIIGLSGYSRVGKSTIASILQTDHGFERYALADPIREALYTLNPIVGSPIGHRLRDIVEWNGWDDAKRHGVYGAEVRGLLQRFGTEVGRNQWGQDYWIDRLFTRIEDELAAGLSWEEAHHRTETALVVVPDVRFANEARAILAYGGEVWKIRRPGVGPVNGHSSDAGIPDDLVTMHMTNNGPLEALPTTVAGMLIMNERTPA